MKKFLLMIVPLLLGACSQNEAPAPPSRDMYQKVKYFVVE